MNTKSTRPATLDISSLDSQDEYDFGEPEVVSVQITPTLSMSFREPTVADFTKIEEFISDSKKETEMLTKVMCLLHVPDPGRSKLTLKNASKLRGPQIRHISDVLLPMITLGENKDGPKSDSSDEL